MTSGRMALRTGLKKDLSRLRTILPWLTAAVLTAVVARPARACDCVLPGPTFHPPHVPEAFAPAVFTSEEVAALTCRPARQGRLACTWTARYVLTRTQSTAISLSFAYPTGADITVSFDGAAVAGSVDALDPRFGVDQRELFATWPEGHHDRLVVEVRADLSLAASQCGCDSARTTNRRRHPLVTRANGTTYALHYRPDDTPGTMRLSLDLRRPWKERHPRLFPGGKGRRITRDVVKERDEPAVFAFNTPYRLDPGGPVAGVGLGFGPEGLRPRLRLGWEVAWPKIWVHSLVIETDARRRVAVIPAWELTYPYTPSRWTPDVGAGVGVPVQLAPVARPGVRVFARLGWLWAAVVGTFDVYPAFRGAPPERLGSLMLQFGL